MDASAEGVVGREAFGGGILDGGADKGDGAGEAARSVDCPSAIPPNEHDFSAYR